MLPSPMSQQINLKIPFCRPEITPHPDSSQPSSPSALICVHLWFPRLSKRQLFQSRIAATRRKQTTAAISNRQLFLLFFFAFLPSSRPTLPPPTPLFPLPPQPPL